MRRRRRGARPFRWAAAAMLMALSAAVGCSGPSFTGRGDLVVRSVREEPVALRGDFDVACFRMGTAGASFYLSDRPLEELLQGQPENGQILHVELLWLPKPGLTPIDASATNVSLQHIVFVGGEVGVYGGAGFAWVKGKLDGRKVRLSIEDASMALIESTPGFNDLLTPAIVTGDFSAVRDEEKTLRLRQAASQIVTDAFGASRYVHVPPPPAHAFAQR